MTLGIWYSTFYTKGNPTAAPGSAVSGSSSTSPVDSSTTTTAVIQGRKSVIAEVYDEVIFQDPTQYMYTLLTTTRKLTLSAYKHETNVEERRDKSLSKIKVINQDHKMLHMDNQIKLSTILWLYLKIYRSYHNLLEWTCQSTNWNIRFQGQARVSKGNYNKI